MATNKYTLSFTVAGKTTEDFTCATGEAKDIKNSSGTTLCQGQITSLSYNKSMYNQCRIDATIQLSGSTINVSDVKDAFFGKVCKMTTSCGSNATIAENYVVYKVTPNTYYSNNAATTEIVLVIYSMDKFLNTVEECHSYVNHHLVTDIVTAALTRYTDGTKYTISLHKKAKAKDTDPEPSVVDNLQFLKYETDNKNYEFIQPYLVQYNETFYNMLIRTANRCGEYVFFEDGKLHIGLKEADATLCSSDFINDTVDLPARSIKSQKAFNNIGHHNRNYISDSSTDSEIASLSKDIEIPGLGTINIDSTTTQFVQDLSVSEDDNLFDYTKDNYTNFDDTYTVQDGMGYLYMGLNDDMPLLGLLARLVAFAAIQLINVGIKADEANSLMNKEVDNINTKAAEGEPHRPFGSKDASSGLVKNIANTGIFIVRRLEQLISDKKIVFHLNTADNNVVVKLGNKITYNNETYIVTSVTGSYDKDGKFYESFEAVPVVTVESTKYCIPPIIPSGHIRMAQPQTAKVVDAMDPKDLGRVRVRFSWQEDDLNDDFKEATPFIRMLTPYAAPVDGSGDRKRTAGVYFQPNTDDEVMVGFDHGNVERPYIMHAMYNATNKPPYGVNPQVPDTSIIKSSNGHRIVFKDLRNEDFLAGFLGSCPLLQTAFENVPGNPGVDFGGDCKDIAGGITLCDGNGFYNISASADKRAINISSPIGSVTLSAFEGITINAPHGDITVLGKNISLNARDNINLESGIALSQNTLNIVGNDATWQQFVSDTLKSIIDLSIIRAVIERIIEPVHGQITLSAATEINEVEEDYQRAGWGDYFKNMLTNWVGTSEYVFWKNMRKRFTAARNLMDYARGQKGNYLNRQNIKTEHTNFATLKDAHGNFTGWRGAEIPNDPVLVPNE